VEAIESAASSRDNPRRMNRGTTLAQKLVARTAGRLFAEVGEETTCRIDLALLDDATLAQQLLPLVRTRGLPVWSPEQVVLTLDRHAPERDERSRGYAQAARDWALSQRLPHVFEGRGIGHVVVPRTGLLRPGMLCIGSDARASTAGAFGALALSLEPRALLSALARGDLRVRTPATLFARWSGRLAAGVSAKDMVLAMLDRLGNDSASGQVIEFCGEAVAALPMAERMTLTNMSAELGARTALVAPDELTRAWLDATGADLDELGFSRWTSDEDAEGLRQSWDASSLAPQVALPPGPGQVRSIDDLAPTRVDIAYLGACTGAKLDDLRAAARVLAGFQVAPGVRLLVAPASVADRDAADRDGILRRLIEAGATVLGSSCGACAGLGNAISEGATVISSTACNLPGRMGAATAQVYLASPFTVAASALTGRISDARPILA
jgi:3-isopropylmalate/(R)-2-methylmalate dehydratase large subunit